MNRDADQTGGIVNRMAGHLFEMMACGMGSDSDLELLDYSRKEIRTYAGPARAIVRHRVASLSNPARNPVSVPSLARRTALQRDVEKSNALERKLAGEITRLKEGLEG